jgi:hypothetical protein
MLAYIHMYTHNLQVVQEILDAAQQFAWLLPLTNTREGFVVALKGLGFRLSVGLQG